MFGPVGSCPHESLLGGPQTEDRRGSLDRHSQGRSRSFGVGLSTVKRYALSAERGEGLAPRKPPGKQRKVDEVAQRLLEGDLDENARAPRLSERRELLARVTGIEVSDSTVSRTLRRMGFSRKKDRWEQQSATSS